VEKERLKVARNTLYIFLILIFLTQVFNATTTYAVDLSAYARDIYRPLIGGVQVKILVYGSDTEVDWIRTLGYLARDSNDRLGFAIVAHCMWVPEENIWSNNASFYQPVYSEDNFIGNNPILIGPKELAFIPLANDVPSEPYILNISDTTYKANKLPVTGYFDLDEIDEAKRGQWKVYKTGRTTGTTSGFILEVYRTDRTFTIDFNGVLVNITARWIETSAKMEKGDSGSPLYYIGFTYDENGNKIYEAKLIGILSAFTETKSFAIPVVDFIDYLNIRPVLTSISSSGSSDGSSGGGGGGLPPEDIAAF